MQHAFTGNRFTARAELAVSERARRDAVNWMKYNPGYEDGHVMDRNMAAYCILRDSCENNHELDLELAVVHEIARLYPLARILSKRATRTAPITKRSTISEN